MRSSATIERESLNFAEKAKAAFGFLTEFAYVVEYADATLVRYVGPHGKITIYHGRLSYEIGVEFSPENTTQSPTYSLGLLIETLEENTQYQNPCADTVESVESFLFIQADRVRKYGDSIFSGQLDIWTRLDDRRKSNALKMEISSKLNYARSTAEKAFSEKRFGDVVRLLSDVEPWLTPTEKGKLIYARKHA